MDYLNTEIKVDFHTFLHRGHLTLRFSEVFPWISPLFRRFPNKWNQSHNWLGKKGWLSLLTFYNHTSLSPLILHASTKTWYRSIKESVFYLNINTFLLLTPYIPFVFFSRNLHPPPPPNDLDIYWQQVCKCNHLIGSGVTPEVRAANEMPAFAHTSL